MCAAPTPQARLLPPLPPPPPLRHTRFSPHSVIPAPLSSSFPPPSGNRPRAPSNPRHARPPSVAPDLIWGPDPTMCAAPTPQARLLPPLPPPPPLRHTRFSPHSVIPAPLSSSFPPPSGNRPRAPSNPRHARPPSVAPDLIWGPDPTMCAAPTPQARLLPPLPPPPPLRHTRFSPHSVIPAPPLPVIPAPERESAPSALQPPSRALPFRRPRLDLGPMRRSLAGPSLGVPAHARWGTARDSALRAALGIGPRSSLGRRTERRRNEGWRRARGRFPLGGGNDGKGGARE